MQTMETLSPLIRVLFPDFCKLCGKYGYILCSNCTPFLVRNTRHINEYCIASLSYKDENVRSVILSLKARNNPELANTLSHNLYESLIEHLAELAVMKNFSSPLVLPVPASHERMMRYGHNQAELLARALVDNYPELGGTLHTDILYKKKTLIKQAKTKSRIERFQNISHAYNIAKPELVVNKCIIIVDDIITTGATMSALRNLLLLSGARFVLCIAVAH